MSTNFKGRKIPDEEKEAIRSAVIDRAAEFGYKSSIDGDWVWCVPTQYTKDSTMHKLAHMGFQLSWKGRETTAGKAILFHKCLFLPDEYMKSTPIEDQLDAL